jgi:hypothetical protein
MDIVGMDESDEMFVVVSDLDGGAYGPFFILARAREYAEVADGSVFRLQRMDDDEGACRESWQSSTRSRALDGSHYAEVYHRRMRTV